MSELDLKPCCGHEPRVCFETNDVFDQWTVSCFYCGSETQVYGVRNDAIDAWNKRAEGGVDE